MAPVSVSRPQVQELARAGAQVVEVLPAEEYAWAHLPGAVNLPLKELEHRLDELSRSGPVVVYCNDTL